MWLSAIPDDVPVQISTLAINDVATRLRNRLNQFLTRTVVYIIYDLLNMLSQIQVSG